MAGEQARPTAAERAMASLLLAQDCEPELGQDAAKLLTLNGLLNALANLLERFKGGGDRDELAAMNGEHKTLKLAFDVLTGLLGHQVNFDNGKRLAAIEAALGRKERSGSASLPDDFDPPEADRGTN